MAWEIQWQDGVKTDACGRKFRILRNSFGRQDIMYIQETNAPQGYSIPQPPEWKPPVARKLVTTTDSKGNKVPVVHKPKRLHVVELRKVGQAKDNPILNTVIKEVSPNGSNGLAAYIDSTILRYDGKEWKLLFPPVVDFHIQYHIDEEIK